jgi:hypothetical protein
VFYSSDYSFDGKTIRYSDLKSTTTKSRVYKMLKENDKIECISDSGFKIGDNMFKNKGKIILFE